MSGNPHQPKLVFIGEPFAGRVCELTQDKITMGRGSRNALAIHHPSVSHAHCEILVFESEVIVRDLHSTNGTFIQGVRISPQAQLKHGQTVRFGDVAARLELAWPDEDELAAAESAVLERVHVLRDRTAPKQARAAAELSAGLSSQEDSPGQTVLMNLTSPLIASTAPPVQPLPERAGDGVRTKPVALIVAAAAAGLAMVVWLVLRK